MAYAGRDLKDHIPPLPPLPPLSAGPPTSKPGTRPSSPAPHPTWSWTTLQGQRIHSLSGWEKMSLITGSKKCVGQKQLWTLPGRAVTGRCANSDLSPTNTHWATEWQKELQEHIFWEGRMSSHQVYKALQSSPPWFYEFSISYRKEHQISINRVQNYSCSEREKENTLSSDFLILTNLAKALEENQRMVTDTVSSLKHIFGLTTRTTIPSSDTSYITEISCTYIHVFISTGQVK